MFTLKTFEGVLKRKNIISDDISWNVDPTQYFVVQRGVKPKKYKQQQGQIKKDLEFMSIRKVALKYNCSTRTIQLIKNDKY
jgi:hypothetical protein